PSHHTAYQSLSGEQRHLGVVGDGPTAPVRDLEAVRAVLSPLSPNSRERQELQRPAEGVSYGSTEQATLHTAPHRHRRGLPIIHCSRLSRIDPMSVDV